jgi:hypothetical protein
MLLQYPEDSKTFVEKSREMNYYAPYMVIEGAAFDQMSWTRPELGGLPPSIAKRGFLGYSVYKRKYQSETKKYLEDYVRQKYNFVPPVDHLFGFMSVELLARAANKAGSLNREAMIKVMTDNTFKLAAHPYRMNETGGNAAEFHWGVGQFIPEDIEKADDGSDDLYTLWPPKYKERDVSYPFMGWK